MVVRMLELMEASPGMETSRVLCSALAREEEDGKPRVCGRKRR
jgi:hypothetical protein